MRFSCSSIGLYLSCPFKYYARYILGIETPSNENLEFGSLFHSKVSEMIINKKVNESIEDKKLLLMLKNLWNNKEFQEVLEDIQEPEVKEKIDIDGEAFTYICDNRNNKHILEFKSAKSKWPENKFFEEIQPHIYMKGELQRTNINKIFHYFIIGKNGDFVQHKIVGYNEEIWLKVKNACKQIREDFEFKPTGYKIKNGCMWCDFENHCPTKF